MLMLRKFDILRKSVQNPEKEVCICMGGRSDF
jgi:hypothetical protein